MGRRLVVFDITIAGKTYRVEIPDPGASPLQVIVDGESFQVDIAGALADSNSAAVVQPAQLPPPRPVTITRPAAPASTDGDGTITAPMPGTILSVEVELGQHLEAGQVVCVLEAMKMKNPIRTTRRGTVLDIGISPGQTVAFGDLLVRLS